LQAKTAILEESNGIFDIKNLRNAEQNHNFGPKRKILMRGFSYAWPALVTAPDLRARLLVGPKKIENWSLTSLQQQLMKTGGRLVKNARNYWLMSAESHLTERLFAGMVRRMDALATG
jgi:hypothetical protein